VDEGDGRDRQMVFRDGHGGVRGQKVLKDRVGDETMRVQLDLLVVEGVEDAVDFRLMKGVYVASL
jgi:hypothetical protein